MTIKKDMLNEDIIITTTNENMPDKVAPEEINHICGDVFIELLRKMRPEFTGIKIESVIANIRNKIAAKCFDDMSESGVTALEAIKQIAFYTGFTVEGMRINLQREQAT